MNSPNLADSGLKDGVAIVTGGSGGIGRAIVELLAASGMDVIFTYRENAPAAKEVRLVNVSSVEPSPQARAQKYLPRHWTFAIVRPARLSWKKSRIAPVESTCSSTMQALFEIIR